MLAKEVAPRGITVNTISPGVVETDMMQETMSNGENDVLAPLVDMTPLGRLGQPQDIADAVAFLVEPDARWVTRQNFPVDGGIISR